MLRKDSASFASSARSSVWGLDGLPARAAEELAQWLDGLPELTLDEWRAIGRQCLAEDGASHARSGSDSVLEATIARREFAVTAWFVRDLVETATHRVRGEAERTSRAAQREVARGVSAAAAAALAIAAQEDWLPARDRQELRAPFDRLTRGAALRLA